MMAFVRRKASFSFPLDWRNIGRPTELGILGKLGTEHSISANPKTKQNGWSRVFGEVSLLWIKLNYLKSNSQCPPNIGSNLAKIGYLRGNSYQERVTINSSPFTRYLGKIIKRMSWHPKTNIMTKRCTTGWPKGGDSYWSQSRGSTCFGLNRQKYDWGNAQWKGRSTVKALFYNRYYSTGGTKSVIDKVKDLSEWCSQHPDLKVDRKIYKLVCNPELLYMAYNNIQSKPGNMTPGIVPTTLDGMSKEAFTELSDLLKDESFNFKPGRRIQVPKPKGKSTPPLTIAPPRDKIVQEAMRIILSAIYEPTFLDSSHGFRPQKSCHTALKHVYTKFKGVSWIIEGEINKCFDTIDHHKLVKLIESKILDKQFTKLIWKSLRAGYFEFRVLENNLIGTPQGSIISPVLANIFLHQLDTFVEKLCISFEKGVRPRVSPAYTKIRHQKNVADRAGDVLTAKRLQNVLLNMEYSLFADPNFKRLFYVRYADDWLIGIRGSKDDAIEIKNSIAKFLDSIDLTLSEEKSKISNLNTDFVKFLGVMLTRSSHTKYFKNKSILQRTSMKLRLLAPLDDIKEGLTLNKFLAEGKTSPKFVWMGYSHKQILLLYNNVQRGYLNYYSFVHNYSRLSTYLYWTLKGSCGKLLAAKFTLGSMQKVMSKFGKDLSHVEDKLVKINRSAEERGIPKSRITKFYRPENLKSSYFNF